MMSSLLLCDRNAFPPFVESLESFSLEKLGMKAQLAHGEEPTSLRPSVCPPPGFCPYFRTLFLGSGSHVLLLNVEGCVTSSIRTLVTVLSASLSYRKMNIAISKS